MADATPPAAAGSAVLQPVPNHITDMVMASSNTALILMICMVISVSTESILGRTARCGADLGLGGYSIVVTKYGATHDSPPIVIERKVYLTFVERLLLDWKELPQIAW